MSHSSLLATPALDAGADASGRGAPPSSRRPRSRREGGFTILEIMVVLAIIGLLVGVMMSSLTGSLTKAESNVASLFVTTEVEIPLTSYRIDMGDYPSAEDGGLNALWTAPANKADRWHGPYAKGTKAPLDPWKRDYKYLYPGVHNKGGYDIWSTGKSGVDGGPDNIGNW